MNLGVFPRAPAAASELLTVLEYNDVAIHQGELWRLVTGNLVHFSPSHFYLDVGVFLVLGLLYEPYLGRCFPWLLLVMSAAIGMACLIFMNEHIRLRGLSGVDSGLFAAALWVEFHLARRDPWRWLWLGPAAAIFVVKIVYETATGQSLLGTQAILGDMPIATTAHLAGVVAALLFCASRQETFASEKEDSPENRVGCRGFRR